MTRPSGRVPVIHEEITLDGRFEEDAWNQALLLDQFTEVIPNEGSVGDPRTMVRIMRSETHLYLAITCMEPNRSGMVLQNLRRDAILNNDDRIEFVFDTFHDAKTSYFFQISAAGSRGDALLGDNGRRFNKPWDGFWKAETKVLEDRWVSEVSIPFATMSFGENDIWGANFERMRGENRSIFRWAGAKRELRLGNVSESGKLSGFAGIQQGSGVEFRTFYKLKSVNPSGESSDILHDIGGEVSWSITPQMNSSVTWNTDFAETEVDERRVNLSRFPLFFPEKRHFFLQDTTLFQFGERGGGGDRGVNLVPFFSRRIGLQGGTEVPIDVGLRVAGRAGPWDLGFLGVRTDEADSVGVPDGELFVFRPSYNVSNRLAVGALFTDGNPASDFSNTVVGADMRYSSTQVLPGSLSVNSYFLHSDDGATARRGLGFGTEARLTTSFWDYNFSVLGTQADFEPSLGFVRRPGEMRTSASVFWNPRSSTGPVRRFSFGLAPLVWTDLGGETISSTLRLGLFEAEFQGGDSLRFNTFLYTDRPDAAFDVTDSVSIQPGSYSWAEHQLRYSSSQSRPLSGRIELGGGNWYDGGILRFRTGLNWHPTAQLNLNLEYNEERGNISGGDFTVRVERFMVDYSFNSGTSLETLIQSDNQSDTLGLQARYRWILEDGRELFVVLDSGWEELATGAIVPQAHDVTFKIVYSIRI
ncbi:MAG: carbohydrate binding family 9 domain-containing protein [Planctomycetota bacterium]|nr:carbohydrate binding family 9 domain-containing protein [Planctomycetota bacterium]